MRTIMFVTIAALLTAGCSTRPREFRPTLASPAEDVSKFDETLLQCQVMVRKGVKTNFATTAAQLGGGTAGAYLGGALAGSLASGSFSAAINAAGAGFFIAGPLAGFGVSRLIRTGREKKYREALGSCLYEFGYTAESWEKQKKLSEGQVNAVVNKWKAAATASTAVPTTRPAAPN